MSIIQHSGIFLLRIVIIRFNAPGEPIYFWYLKGGCLFETGRLLGTGCIFLLKKKKNVKQSIDVYLTEDQKDWKTDLSLDPSSQNFKTVLRFKEMCTHGDIKVERLRQRPLFSLRFKVSNQMKMDHSLSQCTCSLTDAK